MTPAIRNLLDVARRTANDLNVSNMQDLADAVNRIDNAPTKPLTLDNIDRFEETVRDVMLDLIDGEFGTDAVGIELLDELSHSVADHIAQKLHERERSAFACANCGR